MSDARPKRNVKRRNVDGEEVGYPNDTEILRFSGDVECATWPYWDMRMVRRNKDDEEGVEKVTDLIVGDLIYAQFTNEAWYMAEVVNIHLANQPTLACDEKDDHTEPPNKKSAEKKSQTPAEKKGKAAGPKAAVPNSKPPTKPRKIADMTVEELAEREEKKQLKKDENKKQKKKEREIKLADQEKKIHPVTEDSARDSTIISDFEQEMKAVNLYFCLFVTDFPLKTLSIDRLYNVFLNLTAFLFNKLLDLIK